VASSSASDCATSRSVAEHLTGVYEIVGRFLGPIIVRMASFSPFHATYWLNGHSCIEREPSAAAIPQRRQ
jgi:hypothetical protein